MTLPDHFSSTTHELATAYFHWFFLIQHAPLPEQVIIDNSEVFLLRFLPETDIARRKPSLKSTMLPQSEFTLPVKIIVLAPRSTFGPHAGDSSRRRKYRLLVLWDERSTIAQLYNVRRVWREQAANIQAGHHLAEELPERTLAELTTFLQS